MNVLLYVSVVLIWGTTWLAIAVQTAYTPPLNAVFWRFATAVAVLWLLLAVLRRLKVLGRQDQLWCAVQGACVFCLNFVCLYSAVKYINSGLLAVIFSLSVWFNALNSRLFFGHALTRRFAVSALLGLCGMLALFWPDMSAGGGEHGLWRGMAFAVAGTYLFSLGNMVSLRHQRRGLNVFHTNAWAMLYGTVWLALLVFLSGQLLVPPSDGAFWLATFHVAVPGTVVGFAVYFLLVGRIGAAKAAYSMLLTPLVALAVSTVWEGHRWHAAGVLGVALILYGNYLMFSRPPARP